MKEGLSDQERLAVVNEAIRLIQRPETFVQGDWKCPVYVLPKLIAKQEGTPLMPLVDEEYEGWCYDHELDPDQQLEQAIDKDGRPLFAFCVEGAINQAGINILGPARAVHFGAGTEGAKYAEDGNVGPSESSDFTEYLSVNDVARVMFADEFRSRGGYGEPMRIVSPAQYVNDGLTRGSIREGREVSHKRVMRILRKRAKALLSSKATSA